MLILMCFLEKQSKNRLNAFYSKHCFSTRQTLSRSQFLRYSSETLQDSSLHICAQIYRPVFWFSSWKLRKIIFCVKKRRFFNKSNGNIQKKCFASFRTDIKNPVCKFLRIGVYDNPVKFYSCISKFVTWEDCGVFRIFRFENNVRSSCGHKCQLRDLGLGMCSSFRALNMP